MMASVVADYGLSVRTFVFSKELQHNNEHSQDDDNLVIRIPEELKVDYGMFTWPCAAVLAQYIWYNERMFNDRVVLELGAGTALPGIVAAKCGALVTLSDYISHTSCLDNCRRNCMANELHQINVIGLTWGVFTPQLAALRNLNYILASDCFYDRRDFINILATVAFLFEINPHAQLLSTYQVRSSNWSIEDLLKEWRLSCEHIPLWQFRADMPNIAGSSLPGHHSVQMLKLTKIKDK